MPIVGQGATTILWREVVRAACCILNMHSTKLHLDKTPDELFFGHKPLMANLRVFGSKTFVHNNRPNPGKLAHRSKDCILLSQDMQLSKGWHCYQPST